LHLEARWPRGLRREDAARYVGVSPSKLDEMVVDRRVPQPREIDRRLVWDVRELDDAFDDLPRRGEPDNIPAAGRPVGTIIDDYDQAALHRPLQGSVTGSSASTFGAGEAIVGFR